MSNQRQRNYNCTVRLTRSLLLPTQAYNSSHFYMVRLVWFPGHMDWEHRERSLRNTRQTANADVRGARSAQGVSLVICHTCCSVRDAIYLHYMLVHVATLPREARLARQKNYSHSRKKEMSLGMMLRKELKLHTTKPVLKIQ